MYDYEEIHEADGDIHYRITLDGDRIATSYLEENAQHIVQNLNSLLLDAKGEPARFIPDDQGGNIEFNGKIWRPEQTVRVSPPTA